VEQEEQTSVAPLVTRRNTMRQFQDLGHWSNVHLCDSNPDVRRLQSISFILFVGG